MNKNLRRIVPLILAVCIIICIGWYLFVYDRTFTRDILLNCARYFDGNGNAKLASYCYDRAYIYSGNDEEVAIELANQYKDDGNYTKAEVTLTNAIADGGAAELYVALCKTYVEQDKLLDAVTMLENVGDPAIKAELDALRPAAPTPDHEPGFYNQYISVTLSGNGGVVYCNANGEYPSTEDDFYSEPIALQAGETTLYSITVGSNGLVSPVGIMAYTINGVIEPAVFTDSAMEAAVRKALNVDGDEELFTNDLWELKEFTVPADAGSLDDLKLLPYVEKLTISNHKLSSLSALTPLSKLSELDLSGSRFPSTDLEILANLPSLTKLSLSNCGLSTVAALKDSISLTSLDLSSNTVRNLEALSSITTLTELNLQHNALTGLNALSVLADLTKLDISYNSVSDLSPLSACVKLTWLDASHNGISKLSALDEMSLLSYLALDHNEISDISILKSCTALTELYISNNQLVNIAYLNDHSTLEVLDFSHNSVYEVPIWSEGGNLRSINGSYNQIENIDTLWNMEQLTYIYMDYNAITSIGNLAKCTNLVMVNVYGNEVYNVHNLTDRGIIVNWDPSKQ